MEGLWYKDVAYEDAKELVKENLVNTVAAFIASGYWLKCIRDSRGYEKDGYKSLWECADFEFGLGISEASRAMSMNDKYSIDGNSPFMIEYYKQYSKSQLQEMLAMTDEQLEQVTPDMTIKKLREMKNQELENSQIIQSLLEACIRDFVSDEYINLSQFYAEAAVIDREVLWESYNDELNTPSMQRIVLMDNSRVKLVSKDTGEIVGECDTDLVISEINRVFPELKEKKQIKICPKGKGLMDDPYCGVCGTPLNSPETDHTSISCAVCGQAVEWSNYIKNFCDVATNTVGTECEEESVEEFLTEIEVVPEQEEELNVEFNTDELMQDLDEDTEQQMQIGDYEVQEMFIKIINRLKEKAVEFIKDSYGKCSEFDAQYYLSLNMNQVEEVVYQAAAEYNNGWISVDEQLPEEPEGDLEEDELQEYIVVIDGASKATALYYAGDGEWQREGDFYRVLAWQPFPGIIQNKEQFKWSDGEKLFGIVSRMKDKEKTSVMVS